MVLHPADKRPKPFDAGFQIPDVQDIILLKTHFRSGLRQFLDSLEESKAIERDSTCFVCGIADITGGIHNVPLDGYFTPMCAACEKTYNKHGMSGLMEQ